MKRCSKGICRQLHPDLQLEHVLMLCEAEAAAPASSFSLSQSRGKRASPERRFPVPGQEDEA